MILHDVILVVIYCTLWFLLVFMYRNYWHELKSNLWYEHGSSLWWSSK